MPGFMTLLFIAAIFFTVLSHLRKGDAKISLVNNVVWIAFAFANVVEDYDRGASGWIVVWIILLIMHVPLAFSSFHKAFPDKNNEDTNSS